MIYRNVSVFKKSSVASGATMLPAIAVCSCVTQDDAELARQLQEEEDIGGGRPRRRGTKKAPVRI